jgi:hypothetical protein
MKKYISKIAASLLAWSSEDDTKIPVFIPLDVINREVSSSYENVEYDMHMIRSACIEAWKKNKHR